MTMKEVNGVGTRQTNGESVMVMNVRWTNPGESP